MPAVALPDVTPISAPSEPVLGELVTVSGAGAQQVWVSPSASSKHAVSVVEEGYYFEPRDVRWTLERGESGWTATDLVTGIFGFGEDANAAIVDLLHALMEHREVLERQDELSPDLQEQLEYLRRQ
jgi:hypothetical protein